jgi:nitroreductase
MILSSHIHNSNLSKLLVEEAIKKRRSIRKYLDKPVSKNQINKIIEAGTYAPSGKNIQSWRFTVLTGNEKHKVIDLIDNTLQSLKEKHGIGVMGSSLNTCRIMKEAPVLVLVWDSGVNFESPRLKEMLKKLPEVWSNSEKLSHSVLIQGVSAAIQNMLLMAHSMGLGSLWIADIFYAYDELTAYFNSTWELVAGVSFGYPEASEMNKSPPSKLSVEDVTDYR